jgi:hypothetical protein
MYSLFLESGGIIPAFWNNAKGVFGCLHKERCFWVSAQGFVLQNQVFF